MAIRYSGDVEVKITHPPGEKLARVTVTWPRGRVSGNADVKRSAKPEDHDRYALKAIELVMMKHETLPVEKEGRRIIIRRVFQAPCPR